MRTICSILRQSYSLLTILRAQQDELYGKIKAFYNNISGNSNIHYLNKRRYDSFYGTPLDSLLRERNIKDIEIVGVCTDICILHCCFSL